MHRYGRKVSEWCRRTREAAGDDGAAPIRGIMSVAGGFLVQLTLGSYYSFANMMPYMVSYMRRHSDEADPADPLTYGDFIVVQSAWGITQGCVLPVAGALVNYIGVRSAVVLGSVMFAAGPALTSYSISTTLPAVVLTYGVLSSAGQNLAVLPTLTLPMAWFPHRRGLVAGIVVSGFGFGAFVFNQLQTAMANPADLPAARNGTDDDGYFLQEEVLQATPGLLWHLGALYAALLALGSAMLLQTAPASRQCRLGVEQMCRRVAKVATSPVGSNLMSKAEEERSKKEGCCFSPSKLKSMLPTRDGNLAKVLAYREVYLLWATRFGMVLISQGLAGFYKAFGLEELGFKDDFLSRVGAIAGIFNCLGRIFFGVMVDRVSYKKLMLVEAFALLALLSSFYWTSTVSQWAFASSLWLCFFCISGTFAMHPAVCGQIFGPGLEFVAIGLVGSSDIANNLLIGVFSSHIMELVGWSGYFVTISSLCLLVVAATLLFPMENLNKRRPRKKTREEMAALTLGRTTNNKKLGEKNSEAAATTTTAAVKDMGLQLQAVIGDGQKK